MLDLISVLSEQHALLLQRGDDPPTGLWVGWAVVGGHRCGMHISGHIVVGVRNVLLLALGKVRGAQETSHRGKAALMCCGASMIFTAALPMSVMIYPIFLETCVPLPRSIRRLAPW